MLDISWRKYNLKFTEPRGTSRGWFKEKPSWFIIGEDKAKQQKFVGECALLPGLSIDDRPGYEQKVQETVESIKKDSPIPDLTDWPSIQFGLEIFKAHRQSGNAKNLLPNSFSQGNDIKINGLIWMGEKENMLNQIKQKLESGFTCIKLKIGSIDFKEELDLIKFIRKEFSADQVVLRVDANGAFEPESALEKLKRLSEYSLHSIEQPIAKGQWEEMAKLCQKSPLAIALDEELIGTKGLDQKIKLIEAIEPQCIVLKPSLLGGFQQTREWIDIAQDHEIEWWNTSALESDIGLNAIAQFTSSFETEIPQGLGTGRLFKNNISSPLCVQGEYLHYSHDKIWKYPF